MRIAGPIILSQLGGIGMNTMDTLMVGPLGGGLSTPAAFLDEVGRAPLMTRARAIDGWRLRHDPWLRAGYARAGLVLGVAPYVAEALAPVPVRRFEVLPERSHQGDAPHVERQGETGRLALLHVGRAVRTKGALSQDQGHSVLITGCRGPAADQS